MSPPSSQRAAAGLKRDSPSQRPKELEQRVFSRARSHFAVSEPTREPPPEAALEPLGRPPPPPPPARRLGLARGLRARLPACARGGGERRGKPARQGRGGEGAALAPRGAQLVARRLPPLTCKQGPRAPRRGESALPPPPPPRPEASAALPAPGGRGRGWPPARPAKRRWRARAQSALRAKQALPPLLFKAASPQREGRLGRPPARGAAAAAPQPPGTRSWRRARLRGSLLA